MTRLLDSVRLYLHPTLTHDEPWVWLNSGVQQPHLSELTELKGLSFSRDAYIPNNTWQVPTVEQVDKLVTHHHSNDYSRTVGIFPVPDDVLAPLHQLKISQLLPTQTSVLSQPEYKDATEPILRYFTPCCRDRNPTLAGIGISSPGLPTVTFNQQQQQYLGLHLDSWDNLPLAHRHQSTNRICINLGEDDRYFLFINLTLLDMLIVLRHGEFLADENREFLGGTVKWKGRSLLYKHTLNLYKVSPLILKNAFVKRYPHYPVIKVRISPGEAYMSPTENIIHDGSSLGQEYSDVQLTLRGYFRL